MGLTGPVASSVAEAAAGAQLVIDSVNAQGGVQGEQIEIIRLNDGFDVKRAGENARVLIEERKVVALFMNRGTPHAQATYQREAEKAVQHLHTVGIDRIAVVHAADSFGRTGSKARTAASPRPRPSRRP